MQSTRAWFRLVVSAILLTVACVVGNLFIPTLLLDWWVRDADVGLWFCVGLFLTQLSIPGWLTLLHWGRVEWRLLAGGVLAMICILSAWGGFLMSGPVSQADALMFMVGVFVPPVCLVALDLLWIGMTGFRIAPQIVPETPWGAVSPSSPTPEAMGDRHEWTFGLASLFGWVVLVAMAATLWKHAANMNAIAFRDVRVLVGDSAAYAVTRLAFLGFLHVGSIFGTLAQDKRKAWACLLPGFFLGLEGMRRLVFVVSGSAPPYLEWDFALLAVGFFVGHLLLGTLLNYLGLSLQRR